MATAFPAAGVPTTMLTVPAGQTYLVKSVFVLNNSGAADAVQCWALDPAVTVVGYFVLVTLAATTKIEWEGFLAMNPGDKLNCQSQNGVSHFWVSGTKLVGVA